jgi:hypothetical protein
VTKKSTESVDGRSVSSKLAKNPKGWFPLVDMYSICWPYSLNNWVIGVSFQVFNV